MLKPYKLTGMHIMAWKESRQKQMPMQKEEAEEEAYVGDLLFKMGIILSVFIFV